MRRYTAQILKHMNGIRSLSEIFDEVRKALDLVDLTDAELLADFRPTYDVLNRVDIILLRHKSILPFPTGPELQARGFA